MTVTLHEDVVAIVAETADEYGISPDQAANFLIRFATMDKPGPAVSEMLILDADGDRCYRYPTLDKERPYSKGTLTPRHRPSPAVAWLAQNLLLYEC